MNVPAYLERIRYRGPLDPNAGTLRRLHRAHLLSVPFENLSIHRGEPIRLDDEALFDKVVTRRRGGFCYELNGLFAALLRALGFEVAMLSAEVQGAAGTYGPEHDHMALLVPLEDRWLADVGFGDSFREPLRVDERGEQREGDLAYRVEATGDGRRILARREGGGPWEPQYRFGLEPHVYADYADRCRFHQTSPDSHFVRNRLCSLATPDGRITLSGRKLITTRGSERWERELAGGRELSEALQRHFGIVLT
jgi:N-hydroxyarylamine O-acetyltransferase